MGRSWPALNLTAAPSAAGEAPYALAADKLAQDIPAEGAGKCSASRLTRFDTIYLYII